MEAVFLRAVNMSITASWLVLIVLVLRLVLKRAPKAIHCILWAMVALRLLCPVTLESSFSLVELERTESTVDSFMDDYVGSYRIYWDITDEYQTALDAGIMPIRTEGGGSYVVTGTTTPASEPTLLADVLAPVWVIGIILMALHAVISYFIVCRKVRASIRVDKTIRLCDHIGSPFILGIIRPKIYLPSDLDPKTAAHVLAHEQAHLKRRDHWWKPLGFALLSVYWFNPVMWLAYILLCRDIEQACDEKVVKELDIAGKKAYSQALLECSVPRRMIAACPLAFGEVGVKSRIKSVLNYKKPAFWIIVVAVVACIAAAVCFLTDPEDEGPTAYEVTSELWIYDSKTVDVTVWDDEGSHEVYLTKPQIEELSEIIHYLEEDEFIKEKPAAHKLYAVLHCEEFIIDLHWDGEYAYFTFDAATNERITSNRRSVKNEELNAFLAGVVQQEYRMAVGTYVPIAADSYSDTYYRPLSLVQTYRYEVSEDAFTIYNLETGDVSSYTVDWGWEGYTEALEKIPVYEVRSLTQSFDILEPELNDWTLKYQYISEDYHLLSQNGEICLVIGKRKADSEFVTWQAHSLIADHPQLLPPKSLSECLARIDEMNTGDAFNRSGDRRPGNFDMTEEEMATLRTILSEMPEDALTPGSDIGIESYIYASCGKHSENAIDFSVQCFYDYESVTLRWYDPYTETEEYYLVDYAPLKDFLESMMQPERIDWHTVMIDFNHPTYVSYEHEDIIISLIKAECWDYEIVPYVDDQTAFGIRAKPEWMEDWLFFGYYPGEFDVGSSGLYQGKFTYETVGGIQETYLFETPGIEIHAWREWPEPWKMIYRHPNGGTYFIYNEGAFDERLAEHDSGGYMYIERSFNFIFSDEASLIDSSRKYVDVTKYEKPEVSYDAETHSFNVLWHRKDSDGYIIVHIYSLWFDDAVTEVAGTGSE